MQILFMAFIRFSKEEDVRKKFYEFLEKYHHWPTTAFQFNHLVFKAAPWRDNIPQRSNFPTGHASYGEISSKVVLKHHTKCNKRLKYRWYLYIRWITITRQSIMWYDVPKQTTILNKIYSTNNMQNHALSFFWIHHECRETTLKTNICNCQ